MRLENYLTEAAGVKDLDSTVRKILRELKFNAAKFATTAIRGYHSKVKAGVMTQSDAYEFRVDTHTMSSGQKNLLDEFRKKLKAAGLTWKENHAAFIFNRKENELPPEYDLSPEAKEELLNPKRVLYKDRTPVRENPVAEKIYQELSFKGLAETKRVKGISPGRGRPAPIYYRIVLTKKGEKARHLLRGK